MLSIHFIISILSLLLTIEIIEMVHTKEGYGIYLYDLSHNKITDSDNNHLQSSFLYPNVEDKNVPKLMNMFSDISFCDNLDDLSYSFYDNKYILKDDLLLYKEGFSEINYNMTPIEKIYLFMVGLLFIFILSKF